MSFEEYWNGLVVQKNPPTVIIVLLGVAVFITALGDNYLPLNLVEATEHRH